MDYADYFQRTMGFYNFVWCIMAVWALFLLQRISDRLGELVASDRERRRREAAGV